MNIKTKDINLILKVLKEYRQLKVLFAIVYIMAFILASIIIYLVIKESYVVEYEVDDIGKEEVNKIMIFDNIMEGDKEKILDIMYKIKPLYLSSVNNITITYDKDVVSNNSDESRIVIGTELMGEIKILFLNKTDFEDGKSWKEEMKILICHEITHSFVDPEKDINNYKEEIVVDLESYSICFIKGGN